MQKIVAFVLGLVSAVAAAAQQPNPPLYRASERRVNDLVHTRLDVRFGYAKRYLYGKEWLTLKPHGTATDSLRLNAKGMDIKKIPAGGPYTIYLEYTARPDELGAKGSAAIRGGKGLYFINPDSAVAGKPVQIWTQGKTNANAV